MRCQLAFQWSQTVCQTYLVTASGCSPAGRVAAVLLGMPVTTYLNALAECWPFSKAQWVSTFV